VLLFGVAFLDRPYRTFASPPQEPDGKVTHTVNGNTETWRIDEPNVKKKIIEFPQIRFQPGDQVRVTGGGCVQTGGHGKTWKRYIDPLGPNSDRLYHGMILIPGAIGNLPADDLSRFARILIEKGHTFTVKAITEPRKQHLWLGYEDDGYGDNGYWGQDEGTQGQCRIGNSWVEHAFVVVTITHGPPPTGNVAPFDMSVNTITPNNPPVDDNLILFNPMWGRQITNPGDLPDTSQCGGAAPYSNPPCTTQPTTEDNGTLCYLHGNDGHHNWAAATYEGTVFWNDKSCDVCDDDYNFRLVRQDDAGMTTQNKVKAEAMRKSMKLEFSSDETIDHFDTPWWNAFHQAVDKDGFSSANAMVVGPDGKPGAFAIVTGLLSLDCPHTCASELHPVWAMAIRVKNDPSDETWAIFVRRFGDEGFCSDEQHYLDDLQADTYRFRLPWMPGASGVGLNPATVFESQHGQATGAMSVAANQGVLLSFTMPVPQSGEGEMVDGELHLTWTNPSRPFPTRTLSPPSIGGRRVPVGTATVSAVAGREDEPEDGLAQLIGGMTQAQRQTFTARIPRKSISPSHVPLRFGSPSLVASLPTRSFSVRSRRPRERAVPDAQKKAKDQQTVDALHAVYGNTIPGFTSGRQVRRP